MEVPLSNHRPVEAFHFCSSLFVLSTAVTGDAPLYEHVMAFNALEKYGLCVAVVLVVHALTNMAGGVLISIQRLASQIRSAFSAKVPKSASTPKDLST